MIDNFSNASEAEFWQARNCAECKKYNDDWLTKEGCKCELNYYITHGFVTGEIPQVIRERMGGEICKEKKSK